MSLITVSSPWIPEIRSHNTAKVKARKQLRSITQIFFSHFLTNWSHQNHLHLWLWLILLISLSVVTQHKTESRIKETPPHAELVVQAGHSGEISSMAFLRDGNLLATAGDDTVKIWNMKTGRII